MIKWIILLISVLVSAGYTTSIVQKRDRRTVFIRIIFLKGIFISTLVIETKRLSRASVSKGIMNNIIFETIGVR